MGRSMIATTQTAEALRAGVRQHGKALDSLVWHINITQRDYNRSPHIPTTALPVAHTLPLVHNSASMFSCEPCIRQRLLSSTCMHNIV
mmetsp:Transcript_21803/g.34991  ORF Transcript_21803/g.34991 Transcript_21803/m.34991 type:complete len:88 (+) Transcript_21803:310-573(+)